MATTKLATGLNGAHVDAYYKGSWALSLTGQAAAANRQLNYVRRNLLQPDGDFLPRGHDYHINVMYLYSNPYFILGSVAAGRLDVATPAVGFLLTQQSADHGGFYARRAEPGRSEVCDTVCTSAAGLAALCAGQLQAARRAADNLAHVMALQPAPAERFFTTLDAAGKLITDDSARYRLIEAGVKKQMWFAVGLPFAFAVKMLEATGETRYRDLAQSYMAFQERGLDAWDVSSSGKAGWGCAMLYRMTGERRYREIALHIGEQIASKQDDSGSWLSLGSTGQGPGDVSVLTEDGLDVTQEYVLWLSLIAANILARDSE
jgi:hypothetical protein